MSIVCNTVFTDHFKFNSLTLHFMMPLNEENATCSALLAQVLKRGCKKYGEMDKISARLEELYGAAISIGTEKVGEQLFFNLQMYYMDNRFALSGEDICAGVMDIAAAMLHAPIEENGLFDVGFFEQEKQNHRDLIAGLMNDKRQYSMIRCKEIMFENEPYRFPSCGTQQCLSRIDNAKLYAFYKKLFQTATVSSTYIGREMDVESLVSRYFSLESGSDIQPICLQSYTPQEYRTVTECYDITQAKLCMGMRFSTPPEYCAARLFNVIFGGSPTSKLFNNVRERLSLCYYCSSSIALSVGSLFIASGIECKNFETARDEILRQLEDMKNGNISDEEFENGKQYLIDALLGIRDSHNAIVNDKLATKLLGVESSLEEQIAAIRKLTLRDIVAVANTVFVDIVYLMRGKED